MTLASTLYLIAETLMVVIIICLGKGWNLTRRKISRQVKEISFQGRLKICIYWSLLVWVSLLNTLWNSK